MPRSRVKRPPDVRLSVIVPLTLVLVGLPAPAQEPLTLISPTPGERPWFGRGLSADGGLVAVGAPWEQDQAGALHIFATGAPQDGLRAPASPVFPTATEGGWQGWQVGLTSTGTLLVSAPQATLPGSGDPGFRIAAPGAAPWSQSGPVAEAGVIHRFGRTATGSLEHRGFLASPERTPGARFGEAFATDGRWVAVAAPTNGRGDPAVWILDLEGSVSERLPLDGLRPGRTPGLGVADRSSPRVAVGLATSGAAGEVALFAFRDGRWQPNGRLANPDPRPLDAFGSTLVLTGDRLFVGAPLIDDIELRPGRIFVFTRQEGEEPAWSLRQTLSAPGDPGRDGFGDPLAVADGFLASTSGNRVLLFAERSGTWELERMIEPPVNAGSYGFGRQLAIGGGRLWVWASQGDEGRGAVYGYELPGPSSTWSAPR